MKQLDRWFRVASWLAMSGWLILALGPTWKWTPQVVGVLVVGLLGALYIWLLLFARPADVPQPRGSFFTFSGVLRLLSNPRAALVAWIHILAFDLMAALWIRADAELHGITHYWLLPIYGLTLMFGPAGLLAYYVLRLMI